MEANTARLHSIIHIYIMTIVHLSILFYFLKDKDDAGRAEFIRNSTKAKEKVLLLGLESSGIRY